jgi:SAM-dependent methyltransferase
LNPVVPDRHRPYLLDNAAAQAARRFEALSSLFDASTRGHLDGLGIAAGWRCWEVGAGGLAIPAWMAERVGAEGYVLATDIDISWLGSGGGNLVVRAHDVAADHAPAGRFDLVHARLVLSHVPDRNEALRRMASVIRPGGWMLVEDFDPLRAPAACLDPASVAQHRANKVRQGFLELLANRGADLRYGHKLPRLLRDLGLEDVGMSAFVPSAGAETAELEHANVVQVAPALVAAGYATPAEIEAHLQALAARRIDVALPPLISAWGQRPR